MADDNDEEGDADGEGDTRRALSLPDQRPSPSSLESGIPSSPAAHDEPEDHMSRGRSAQGSCIRCSADKVKCIPSMDITDRSCAKCKTLNVLCSFKQKSPRVLNRLKCEFCRQSKQACSPSEREWSDNTHEKCQRCVLKELPCSRPSTKSRYSPSRSSDIILGGANTGQDISPLGGLSPLATTSMPVAMADVPIAKKRGRPSKADLERKQAFAVAKVDLLPPSIVVAYGASPGPVGDASNYAPISPKPSMALTGAIYNNPADTGSSSTFLQLNAVSPRSSNKRDRTMPEEEEGNWRPPSRSPQPFPLILDGGHDITPVNIEPRPESPRIIVPQPDKLQVPGQPQASSQPGSPLRVSILASEIKDDPNPSSKYSSEGPRVARKRARANWFRAADIIRKDNQIKKTTSYLTEIAWGTNRILCGVCASMDLTADKFIVSRHPLTKGRYIEDKYSLGPRSKRGVLGLGSLAEIQKRSYKCPFCKLVLYAAQEQTDIDLSDGKLHPDLACFAGWQLDGHEMGSNGESVARTRRIRLHWKGGDFQDSYIVLVANTKANPDDNLFLGRELKVQIRDPYSHIIPTIRDWIDLCYQHHDNSCGTPDRFLFEAMRRQPYFGVVDVQDMKLTSLPQDSRYVALSYTWGGAKTFATKKANIMALQAPNGVYEYLRYFPKAVKEAIELVRDLGERYIWVDSLCIVHDSRDSLKLNLNMMDQIYGNAHFTICAADNPDATAGLVALDPERHRAAQRRKQRIEDYCPGVRLMVSQVMETYIRKTRWNSRAWTFQERILSRRCLIFAEGQVFFQCRCTAMTEDIWSHSPTAGWSVELARSPQQILSHLPDRSLQTYAKVVERYTACHLDSQNKDDILAAFNGISNAISMATNGPFIHGMPDVYFDWALLWEPRYYPKRRLPYSSHKRRLYGDTKSRSDTTFPSWSWSGWLGMMHYSNAVCLLDSQESSEWFLHHTWIIWYIRDSLGRLRLIRQPSLLTQREAEKQYAKEAQTGIGGTNLDIYGRRQRYPLQTGTDFRRTLPEFPFTIDKAESNERLDPLQRDSKYLQFWTWEGYLALSYDECDDHKLSHRMHRFDIIDNKGDWCGTIVLRHDWLTKVKIEPIRKLIAISDARNFSSEECETWNYYIPKSREASVWDLFNVMLIEEDEEGIARRAGLGKVFIDAFEHTYRGGKQWSEFILG